MKKNILVVIIFISAVCQNACRQQDTFKVVVSTEENVSIETEFGFKRLAEVLTDKGMSMEIVKGQTKQANLILKTEAKQLKESSDGFDLRKDKKIITISSVSGRGLMYGLLDMAEALGKGQPWDEIESKSVSAHYPFRAIKFNLPWFSYRSGENLSLHTETCRNLKFWESFLDMMVENKFNTLTLWNLHPYIYMVKPKSFPEASPFTDNELATWKDFWKSLFKMAKQRGIDTYIVNWNIFVSEPFAGKFNTAEYSQSSGFWGEGETNQLIEKYTRELVTQTINEYEDLTGIGITLGERMGGMTSEQRRDWIDRTLIAGLKNADRPARLIYRAPLSAGKSSEGTTSVSTEKITREAIENMGLEQQVWVEFKFNWSHAHSSPKVSIVHGGILTDTYWNPISDKYKGVWTMRNEDFFVLRWAQPDFIRSFLSHNSQEYIGGCIIGSETYIPAKDYITKEEHRSWDYAFQRQWLFYKVWGNLLYNSETPDSYFAQALADKFGIDEGDKLLQAWKLASMNANRFATFHRGTWDATIYTEGFTSIQGKFIDINEFIIHPVLDSSYVNISDFVQGKFDPEKQISPLKLADIAERESNEALAIVHEIREGNISESLDIELTDIEAWAHHGKYFSLKIRGAVALQKFRLEKDTGDKKQAIEHLENALAQWEQLISKVEKYNVAEMPYQFDQNFSWRKHLTDVQRDIDVAVDQP